jgi:hypothetical protein
LLIFRSERYSSSRHSLATYRGITCIARYHIPDAACGADALKVALEDAIALVVSKLGNLSLAIVDEDSPQPFYVRVSSINLSDHIAWLSGGSNLERVIERQICQSWPRVHERPPWKAIVFDSAALGTVDVMFAVHHALGDGRSAMLFHENLLEALNEPRKETSVRDHVLTLQDPPPVLPAQEAVIKFTRSWSFLLRSVWREFAPAWLRPPPLAVPWTGKPIDLNNTTMHCRLIEIPPPVTRDLLVLCRSHGATLTALLSALICSVLAQRLRDDAPLAFVATIPISLRPYVSLPSDLAMDASACMANLVTVQDLSVDSETVDKLLAPAKTAEENPELPLWKLAATLRHQMKERLETLPSDDIMGMLGWVADWRAWHHQKQGKPRSSTLELSNIGSLDNDAKVGVGCWNIGKVIMAQPANPTGAAVVFSVAGVRGQGVTLSLTWQDGIVGLDFAESIAADLGRCFASFAKTRRFGVVGSEVS